MDIKPIETIYKGYRFRSRLEARWAVFLDTLRVQFEYEMEGFDLGGVWYLPDFWLPQQECWLEIKPNHLRTDGQGNFIGDDALIAEKCGKLAVITNFPVYLLTRSPGNSLSLFEEMKPYLYFFSEDDGSWNVDDSQKFGRCPVCGAIDISFEADPAEFYCKCQRESRQGPLRFDSEIISLAEAAARQARF